MERCLWCCRAAAVPSQSRIRIQGTLSSILFSRDRTFRAESPSVFQTLLQGLFSFKYCLSLSSGSNSEMESLAGYIAAVRSGSCGELSKTAVEIEFGVRFSKSDDEAAIRDVLVTESVVRCLEAGDARSQRWVLRSTLEVRPRHSELYLITDCVSGVLANTGTEPHFHAFAVLRTLAQATDVHFCRTLVSLTAVRRHLS